MRWIESDIVKLNSHTPGEADLALKQRFPNAMRWLVGSRRPGCLHGDQISAILKEEDIDLDEFDPEELPAEADADEIRQMIRFLIMNWQESTRVMHFGYEEWSTIFQALRYCAEEIGYLPKTKREDQLRDNSIELSGRLVAEGFVQTGNATDLNIGEIPIYDHDWMTILRACQFAYKNLDPQNDAMREVKHGLKRLTPELLTRIKYHEGHKLKDYGWKEIAINKRLDEIEIEPWHPEKDKEKEQELYRSLRRLQDDHEKDPSDFLHVLRFIIREGAEINVYDRFGKHIEAVLAEEHMSFRQWDMSPQFNSDVFVFGRGKTDRLVVSADDVRIVESEICMMFSQVDEKFIESAEYIYANFTVEKYKRKDD